MVNKNKRRGTSWERDFVKLLEDNIDGDFKRIAGSGALGTTLGEPLLTGDVRMRILGYPKEFKVECKVGYGGSTQLTIKKEWLDKIREEAEQSYSLPLLACKFSGARTGVKYFVSLDLSTFFELVNYLNDLKRELDLVYEKMEK